MQCKKELQEKYHAFGQGHVFDHWPDLSVEEQKDFLVQLNNIDLEVSLRAWRQSVLGSSKKPDLAQATATDGTNLENDKLSQISKQGE